MMEEIQKKEKKVLAVGALVLDIIPIFEELTSEKERTSPGGTIYLKRIDTAIGGSVGKYWFDFAQIRSSNNRIQ